MEPNTTESRPQEQHHVPQPSAPQEQHHVPQPSAPQEQQQAPAPQQTYPASSSQPHITRTQINIQPRAAAPVYVVQQHQYPISAWTTGLFDCFDDPCNALITFVFPCATFGQVAEIVDEGNTPCGFCAISYFLVAALVGIPCVLSSFYRTKLRNKFGIVHESVCEDCCIHFFCETCALCQEHRELQNRGLDPSIGWQAHMNSTQQQQVVMMHPVHQTMAIGIPVRG